MTTPQNPNNQYGNNNPQGDQNLPSYGSYDSQNTQYGAQPQGGQNQYENAYGGASQYGEYNSQFAVNTEQKNGVAIWALVFAIASALMLMSLAFSIFAIVPAIIGIILAAVAMSKAKKIMGPGRRKGMAIAALVISLLVTIISAIVLVGMFVLGTDVVQACEGVPEAQYTACVEDYVNDRFGIQ